LTDDVLQQLVWMAEWKVGGQRNDCSRSVSSYTWTSWWCIDTPVGLSVAAI